MQRLSCKDSRGLLQAGTAGGLVPGGAHCPIPPYQGARVADVVNVQETESVLRTVISALGRRSRRCWAKREGHRRRPKAGGGLVT